MAICNFVTKFKKISANPNAIREVCLAINFISKKELKNALDDLGKQKAVQQVHSVIQMLWILNGFISICKERNVHCRIFCRP